MVTQATSSFLPKPPSLPLSVRRGASVRAQEASAVAELAEQLQQVSLSGAILFLSSRYSLASVGRAIASRFSCPVIAATAAGTIGPGGYQRIGMVGASFGGPEIALRPYLLERLSEGVDLAASLGERLSRAPVAPGWSTAGLVLSDGLAGKEERLVSSLYQSLGNVPLVGGSAADDLRFRRTAVYYDGAFHSDAALFTEIRTSYPVRAMRLHHYAPSGRKLVVTDAAPERRLIRELDGMPAALAYAEAIGAPRAQLDANYYSFSPLLLRIRGENLIRSIRTVNPDHSLTMYCAIEEGLVLELAVPHDTLATISNAFAELRAELGSPSLVIGFESVLRRLDFEQLGMVGEVSSLLQDNRVVGMNTYGEQYNGLHVNQTFTGLGFGGGE